MAAIVAGIISIILGLALGINLLIKPVKDNPSLPNLRGIVASLLLILMGIMILTSTK